MYYIIPEKGFEFVSNVYNKIYYYNPITNTGQWTPFKLDHKIKLPEDWIVYKNNGKVSFYNPKTKKTQYKIPENTVLEDESDQKKYVVSGLLGNYLKQTKTRDYNTLLALGMTRKEALDYIRLEKNKKGGCRRADQDTREYLQNLFNANPLLTVVDLTGCIVTDEVVSFLKQRGNIDKVYIDTSYNSVHKDWSHIFAIGRHVVINNNYGVPPFPPELIDPAHLYWLSRQLETLKGRQKYLNQRGQEITSEQKDELKKLQEQIEQLRKHEKGEGPIMVDFPSKFMYVYDGIKYINNPWSPWFSILLLSLNTEVSEIDPELVDGDANELKIKGYSDWVYPHQEGAPNPQDDITFIKEGLQKGLDPQSGLNALINTFLDGARYAKEFEEFEPGAAAWRSTFKDYFIPFIERGAVPNFNIIFKNYIELESGSPQLGDVEEFNNHANIAGMILQSFYIINPNLVVGKIDDFLPSDWNSLVPIHWEDNPVWDIESTEWVNISRPDLIKTVWENFKNYTRAIATPGFIRTYVKKE